MRHSPPKQPPVNLQLDREASWRTIGIDPDEAKANNCYFAPSLVSFLRSAANKMEEVAGAVCRSSMPISEQQPILKMIGDLQRKLRSK